MSVSLMIRQSPTCFSHTILIEKLIKILIEYFINGNRQGPRFDVGHLRHAVKREIRREDGILVIHYPEYFRFVFIILLVG